MYARESASFFVVTRRHFGTSFRENIVAAGELSNAINVNYFVIGRGFELNSDHACSANFSCEKSCVNCSFEGGRTIFLRISELVVVLVLRP